MVAEYISGLLPSDWPKFIGDLPSGRSEAIALMEYDGVGSTNYFGQARSILQPILKVVVRTESYKVGDTYCEDLKELLHKYHDEVILSMLLAGSTMYLGRDEDKMHEFQLIFNIQIRK